MRREITTRQGCRIAADPPGRGAGSGGGRRRGRARRAAGGERPPAPPPPGLPDRRRPARQGRVLQVGPPDEAPFEAALEELPAPDGAVRAVAGPVEGDPDYVLRGGTLVVSETTRDVRVVVLDADGGQHDLLELADRE